MEFLQSNCITGFDLLLRRKGGREEKVLIGCGGGRVEMGLLERF